MHDIPSCDSNFIASLPEGIFDEVYSSISDANAILDDCSVSFEELTCFSSKLPNKNSSSFDEQVEEYYLCNEDNKRLADYMPTTPRKRKWQQDDDDDENYNVLSSVHSFTDSPIKTPPLPPKKAFKLRVSTPSTSCTNKKDTVAKPAAARFNGHCHDPLLAMPLSEIPTGFDAIIRPETIQSKTKISAKPDNLRTPTTKTTNNKALRHPGKPKMTIAKRETGRTPTRAPDMQISRPKSMVQQAPLQQKTDPLQRLLFPSLDASSFGGQNLLDKNSRFPLQMAPAAAASSNHSNPPSPIPRNLASPDGATILPRRDSTVELAHAYMNAASIAFTPIPAARQKGVDRLPVTVTPEPGKKACAAATPKSKKSKPVSKQTAKSPPKPKEEMLVKKMPAKYKGAQELKWNRRYEEAKEFAKKNGHCHIPNDYPPDPFLGGWAKRQRYQYKVFLKQGSDPSKNNSRTCSINLERIALLDNIGFCWHTRDVQWHNRYKELLNFVQVNGHAEVPTIHSQNQGLAGWVKVQRRQYKLFSAKQKTSMTQERVNLLNKVNFAWKVVPRGNKIQENTSADKPSNDGMVLDTAKILSVNLEEE